MTRIVSLLSIACLTSACGAATRGAGTTLETITVTGCVRNNGAKSSATMDGGYMLINTVTGNATGLRAASPGTASPPEPSDTTPASDATAAGTPSVSPAVDEVEMAHASASYMLDGRDSELRNYIDKRAEITGILEPHIDEPGDVNSKPTRGSRLTHGRSSGLQWLKVASVKVIASGCAGR